jgi:hypothetical protein
MTSDLDALADPLRDRAVKQLKKRRDFMSHLLVYVLVNSFIVLIWAITNSGGFFGSISLTVFPASSVSRSPRPGIGRRR